MRRTFYLAGSSERATGLKRKAQELEQRMLRCLCMWMNDVPKFGASGFEGSSPAEQSAMVYEDILACQAADLFVAVIGNETHSRGTYMEIGARLGVNKPVHIVLDCPEAPIHLFFKHPLVTVHEGWFAFLNREVAS